MAGLGPDVPSGAQPIFSIAELIDGSTRCDRIQATHRRR
jgi:hypothetical protein